MSAIPLASYWLPAAVSGYASAKDWAEWADNRILATDQPAPEWLIRLSLATTVDAVWQALKPVIEAESSHDGDWGSIEDAVLGYLWLRHRRGDFDLWTCLHKAGEYADASSASFDCERFYALLNELDKFGIRSDSSVATAAEALFAPATELAQVQRNALQRAMSQRTG